MRNWVTLDRARIEPRSGVYRYGCCWNDGETLFTCLTGTPTEIRATDGRVWTGILPHPAMFDSGASSHGTWAVAYGAWDNDQLYVFGKDSFVTVDGQTYISAVAIGPKWGNNTVFIEAAEHGFNLYWIDIRNIWNYTVTRLSPTLDVLGSTSIPVTVEVAPPASGWTDVVHADPLWLAGPVVNGVGTYGNMAVTAPDGLTKLYRPMTRGRFTSGQADNTPSGRPGTIVLDNPTGKVLRVTSVDSQIGPIVAATPSGRGVLVAPGPEGEYQIQFSEQWTEEPVRPTRPVVKPPTPLVIPSIFCAYCASNTTTRPSWANAMISKESQIMVAADGTVWNIFATEQNVGSKAHPCIYTGGMAAILALGPEVNNPYDVLSPWIYRENWMTDANYYDYASSVIAEVRKKFPIAPIAPIWNGTTRVTGSGPLLTEQEALDSLTIGSMFGLPAFIFEAGRAGWVPEADDLLLKWRNGQLCSKPVPVTKPPIPPIPAKPGNSGAVAWKTLHR